MLKYHFTINSNVFKQDVRSFKIKIKKCLPIFESTTNFQDFESAIRVSDTGMGFDNANLNDDNAHEVALDSLKN